MEKHHYATMAHTMMSHELHYSIVLMKLVLLWTKYQIHSKILTFSYICYYEIKLLKYRI